jgi:hypothetical protein
MRMKLVKWVSLPTLLTMVVASLAGQPSLLIVALSIAVLTISLPAMRPLAQLSVPASTDQHPGSESLLGMQAHSARVRNFRSLS